MSNEIELVTDAYIAFKANFEPYGFCGFEAFKAGVEWQRSQEQAELAALKAQEPIGWYTDDNLTDKSATTYDWAIAERWDEKGWQLWPLYAAPAQPQSKE